MIPLSWFRYTRKPAEALRVLLNFSVFLVTAIAVGIGSAWYMTEHGSDLTNRRIGPWTVWTTAGRTDADPYTRAYIARSGRLPITSATARYYFAKTDSAGRVLDSSCQYLVRGAGPLSEWWSLAAYDMEGKLMENPAERYAINSAAVLRDNAGRYSIVLSSDSHPGNWLPVSSNYRFQLVLRAYRPDYKTDETVDDQESEQLPEVVRTKC